MWRCLRCGETVPANFDVCWRCGAARGETPAAQVQAGPGDPGQADSTSTPTSSHEVAEDSITTPGESRHGRIVELCSVANLAEAYELCGLFEEAGIRSRVVGDFLGSGAGLLPLGETTTPRIWVSEEDVARAQGILDARIGSCRAETGGTVAGDEYAELDALAEDEDQGPASAAWTRILGQVLVLVGLLGILWGGVWAWLHWTRMRECSATAEAVCVRRSPQWHFDPPAPPPEIPLPREPRAMTIRYEVQYAFTVHGRTYVTAVQDCQEPRERVPVHYAPDQPARHYLGVLTPPWMILAWLSGSGGFLTILGYYLCTKNPRPDSAEDPPSAANEL